MKHFLISPARMPSLVLAVCTGPIMFSDPATSATLEIPVLRDATLYQDATGNQASGAGDFLTAGRNNQGTNSIRRSLLQFDLTTLPAGAVVACATLRLHLTTTFCGRPLLQRIRAFPACCRFFKEPPSPTRLDSHGGAKGFCVLLGFQQMAVEFSLSKGHHDENTV